MRKRRQPSELTKRPYTPPRVEKLGNVAKVTAKTGMNTDLNQAFKPGGGGG